MTLPPEPAAAAELTVDVAYALPQQQTVVRVQLLAGATVADALAAVAGRSPFAELDLATLPVGVFGDRCERERPLNHGDRVEIYRPLHIDPRDARRARAAGDRRNREAGSG
ncbi:MAG: RnfH family protein [Pseudomonadales bacterium]